MMQPESSDMQMGSEQRGCAACSVVGPLLVGPGTSGRVYSILIIMTKTLDRERSL
jgi:hypothetical protein